MMRTMLKSKIHRATVTQVNVDYVGSITIDRSLMEAADMLEHEQVDVLNIHNGARFHTYVLAGPKGSGVICLNGAAARMADKGDTVIILTYCQVPDEEARKLTPTVVHVDAKNNIVGMPDQEWAKQIVAGL